jgi:hypothetical protein
MTSGIAIEYIKQRIQKQDTNFNSNFLDEEFEDALNKGLNDWVRRQHHGFNQFKEGDENTEQRTDDLQILIVPEKKISVIDRGIYSEISKLPEDYRYYKRITPIVSKDNCLQVRLKSFFIEESNVDDYLKDWTFTPSFDFEETFHTLSSNKFKIYHNKDFKIEEVLLTYYRNPLKISCLKRDYDKKWEWKDDVAEVIIDEAVKILSGDIENTSSYELANNRVENNN